MGVFIAVIIILVLVLYSVKDLLAEKDLSSWINMALTSLVLFTVILSIFVILNKGGDSSGSKPEKNKPAAEAIVNDKPSDEEVMLEIAEEYVLAENEYKASNPNAKDSAVVAAGYIKQKYKFTDEEWNEFASHAEANKLFDKARQKVSGEKGINYLISK